MVARHRELLRPDVTDEEVNAVLIAATPNIGFYAVATLVAVLAPHVAAFGYFGIAVVRRAHRARRQRRRGTPTREPRR